MRQVQTCDFCGDDATGLYEPLPPSIPDAPRMLLCEGCRDRLATVVDPLLARIDGDGSTVSDRSAIDEVADRRTSWPDHGKDAGSTSRPTPDRPGTDDVDASDRSAAGSTVESAETVGSTEGVDALMESADELEVDSEVGRSKDASGRPQNQRAGTPHGYRKVMRFLENREFPIARAEAERLVGEAYEFEEDAVARTIDHAVQYGRLREVDGQLKR